MGISIYNHKLKPCKECGLPTTNICDDCKKPLCLNCGHHGCAHDRCPSCQVRYLEAIGFGRR